MSARLARRRRPVACVAVAGLIPALAGPAAADTFYVSPSGDDANPGTSPDAPWRTLARAQAAVRAANDHMTADVVVNLMAGTFRLADTWRLTAADSGTDGHAVVWQAHRGAGVSVSGGRPIAGWVPHDPARNIWKAAAGRPHFRQLYVAGERAVRARGPNADGRGDFGDLGWVQSYSYTGNAIGLDPDALSPAWGNLRDIEVVVIRDWDQNRLRVDTATLKSDGAPYVEVVPQSPERAQAANTDEWPKLGPVRHAWVENAYELLDAPGEWYLDRAADTVYYMPKAGQDLATAEVVAPAVERLVSVEAGARDIKFRGLTFEHSTFLRTDATGYVGTQAGYPKDAPAGILPAAVHLDGASHITFEGNVFRHTAATALGTVNGASRNAVRGNLFEDIGGNGVVLNIGYSDARATSYETVADNYVTRVGREYTGAVGILATYASNFTIEHNEVWDTPYSGISVGWGWTGKATRLRDNRVNFNHVHHTNQIQMDGGGIYTLSNQPDSSLSGNYVHHVNPSHYGSGSPANGFFVDEQTSGFAIRDNVFHDLTSDNIRFNRSGANALANNDAQDPAVKAAAGPRAAHARAAGPVLSPSAPEGVGLAGSPVALSAAVPGQQVRYTRCGADPTEASAAYAGPLAVPAGGVVKARAFAPGLAPGAVLTVRVRDAAAAAAAPAGVRPGLRYRAYAPAAGTGWRYATFPDFDAVTPIAGGVATTLAERPTNALPASGWRAVVYEGYINVPTDGVYTFGISTDTAGRLVIGGREVVVDKYDIRPQTRFAEVGLRAGPHALRAEYLNHGDPFWSTGLKWSPSAYGLLRDVPASALSHPPAGK